MGGFFVDRIYEDISRRTDGDIYIGVVGPVRTGKSTFIKRFMELMVIPGIDNVYRRERARDELPQSGSGRTVMTAEPKFVPEEAVDVVFEGSASASVRLIDCVGYMIPDAEGVTENGAERMVTTPWFEGEVPMTKAAEVGTRKVIAEHATIGLVVTTDGSIADIPRQSYVEAEERAVSELRAIGKPFVVLLNAAEPSGDECRELAESLEEKYGVPCIAVSCMTMTETDIHRIMKGLLYQFPMRELSLWLPSWVEALPADNELKHSLYAAVLESAQQTSTLHDCDRMLTRLCQTENVTSARMSAVDAGTGTAVAVLELSRELYYRTISEQSGFSIDDDGDLMDLLRSLKTVKAEYDNVHAAIEQANETGYGLVMPTPQQMVLHEPQIVSRSGHYSVKLKAAAPALHIIRTDVETEVSPAVGGEKASEEILGFLLQGFDGDVTKIWDSNIFGKSLYDIAEEGLTTKLRRMPSNVRNRLRITMQRVVNDGAYGLICIII